MNICLSIECICSHAIIFKFEFLFLYHFNILLAYVLDFTTLVKHPVAKRNKFLLLIKFAGWNLIYYKWLFQCRQSV